MFVAENGIPIELQVVDIFKGEHRQPAYAAVNPNALVPVLEDGDFRLTESSAPTLEQDKVIQALDHARIAQGPGGAAEMVPGQHHVRMNMYLAQAQKGRFNVIKELGAVDPKEQMVGAR